MDLFSRSGLTKLLIGKSIAEVLVVGAMGLGFYFSIAAERSFGAMLDRADTQTISGWAVDEANPGRRIEVQLFIDGKFVEQRLAADARPGIQGSQSPDDSHAFAFRLPALPPGEHEARVYAVHRGASSSRRTLQLIGNPIRLTVATTPAQ